MRTLSIEIDDIMSDVELVKLMHQAQTKNNRYRVKIIQWDPKYCRHWVKLISKEPVWQDLYFVYSNKLKKFIFYKKTLKRSFKKVK